MNASVDNPIAPQWLTWWAWLTVAAVCPLLFLGALVTTMGAGMADQRSLVLPHQAVQEFVEGGKDVAWKVEHIHRLAGWFAGICGIGLAIGFWFGQANYRWLGFLGLGLIVCQGLLGIFRVQLNSLWGTELAWIHGCLAQVVFAVLTGIAVVVTPSFRLQPELNGLSPLGKWALACIGLVLGQLVMGGLIRHQPSLLVARLHMLGAFVVLAGLLWLVKLTMDERGVFRRTTWIVLALLAVEIALGVESAVHWMARFFNPALSSIRRETLAQMLTRTTHYLGGSLLLAVTTAIAIKAHRSAFRFTSAAFKPSPVCPLPEPSASPSLQGGVA